MAEWSRLLPKANAPNDMNDTLSALQISIHLILSRNLLSNLVDQGHSAETGFELVQAVSNT